MTSPTRKLSLDARARELGEKALGVLEDIMDNTMEESKDRIRAATEILDRGYGKAAQAVVAVPMQRHRQIAATYSNDELDAIIDAEFEAITQRSLPAPKDPLLE